MGAKHQAPGSTAPPRVGGLLGGAYRETLIAAILCLFWFAGSSLNSIFGKKLLKQLPVPTTISLGQLVAINVVLPLFRRQRRARLTRHDITSWVLPLAGLKILSSLSSQLSLLKVPVSYTHTVKGLMPIFTLTLSRIVLRQQHSFLAYISLIPIVGGVVICSVSELHFDLIGLLAALFSVATFSVQNVYSKKVMNGGVDHISVLLAISRASLLLLLPFWLYTEGLGLLVGPGLADMGLEGTTAFMVNLTGTSLASTVQTIAAFTFLSRVSPVTYSVANVGKKVFVIVSSVLVLGNHITNGNATGIAICIAGIALYNKAKLNERRAKEAEKASKMRAGDLSYLKHTVLHGDNRNAGVGPAGWLPFSSRRRSSSGIMNI